MKDLNMHRVGSKEMRHNECKERETGRADEDTTIQKLTEIHHTNFCVSTNTFAMIRNKFVIKSAKNSFNESVNTVLAHG